MFPLPRILFYLLLSVMVLSIQGCLSGRGPNAKSIRKSQGNYELVEVTGTEAIPKIKDEFKPSPPPPSDPVRRYNEEISIRDQLEILITDVSEQSPFYRPGAHYSYGPVEIPSSGEIQIPYIGSVKAHGRTMAGLSSEISHKAQKVSGTAQATVRRASRLNLRAHVMGEVRSSGPVSIDRSGFNVLDLLSAAGGCVNAAHLYIFTLQRDGKEYRYTDRALRADPFLVQDGDILRVERDPNRVFHAMGSINHPGRHNFPTENPTLMEAFSVAGGLNEITSNPRGVFVFRDEGGDRHRAYAINLKDPDATFLAQQFKLQGNDIVYVSEAPLSEWNRTISSILPTGQAMRLGVGAAAGVPGL